MPEATPNLARPRHTFRTVTGWTILFMVLLRVAIGWHLAYEGFYKIQEERKSRWSADGYLTASSGPLRPYFQDLVNDPTGLRRLKLDDIFQRMDAQTERAIHFYQLDEQQAGVLKAFAERKKHGIQDDNNVRELFLAFDEPFVAFAESQEALAAIPENQIGRDHGRQMARERASLFLKSPDYKALQKSREFKKEVEAYRLKVARGEQADPGPMNAYIAAIVADMDKVVIDAYKKALRDVAEQVARLKPEAGQDDKLQGAAARDRLLDILKQKEAAPVPPLGPIELPELTPVNMPDRPPFDQQAPNREHRLLVGYVKSILDTRYMQLKSWCLFSPATEWNPGDAFGKQARDMVYEALYKNHQSANGWRYRDTKLVGEQRDTGFRTDVGNWYDWMSPRSSEGARLRSMGFVENIWYDPDFQENLDSYDAFLTAVRDMELSGAEKRVGGEFPQERLLYDWRKKASAKAALLARLEQPMKDIDPVKMETFMEQMFMDLSDAQVARGPMPLAPRNFKSKVVDYGNMIGLFAAGICLMIGLFTRFSALVGAVLISMYYMTMPPWPNLPEAPNNEGHYLIVNKNVIEACALLMIATSGIGKWCGLDAFISALFRRRKSHPA